MKRIAFVLFMALTLNLQIRSEVLDPQQALARAMNTQTARRLKSPSKVADVRLMETYSRSSQPTVYVFSAGSNAGFMIVSADDEVAPLLGYSDADTVDATETPAAVSYLLDSYAEQIDMLRQLRAAGMHAEYKAKSYYSDIEPLCKTAWGQTEPYNRLCPDGAVTGCVATAYAQILKTFERPEGYAWSNMLNEYVAGQYTDAQADAVANLMRDCGEICNMTYGASSYTAVTAPLDNYDSMGLSSQISFVERDYYTQDEWEKLMYDALKVGPIMYAGQNAEGGHEFVCDGYRNGFFHINWGWNGTYNGYFLLTALDGTSQTGAVTSAGYNTDQNAVIYMHPAANERAAASRLYNMTCDNFTIKQSSVSVGKLITVTSVVYNKTTVPFTGTLDMRVSDLTGRQVCYLNGPSINNSKFGAGYAYSIRIPADLKDGAYVLTPAFTADDGVSRDVRCKLSGVQSYIMTVESGVCTLVANKNATIDVDNFSLNTPIYENEYFNVTAQITNTSDKEYNGFVAVALVDGDTHEVVSVGEYVPLTVPADGSVDFDYGEKVCSVGNAANYCIVLVDKQGNELSEHLSVDVTEGAPSYVLAVDNLTVENSAGVDKNDISISVDVTCEEGFFNNSLTAFIFPKMGGYSVGSLSGGKVFINEGETVTVNFAGQLPKLEAGTTYMVQVSTGSNVFLKKENGRSAYVRFTVAEDDITDVDDVAADAEPVDTQYYTLQGVNVGREVPTAGVYVKVRTLANGERRSTRVAVRN